jgi:hypothetical protein
VDVGSLIVLAVALVGTSVAYALNQRGAVVAGGFALLGGLVLAMALEMVVKAHTQAGVDLGDLRLYDLFVLPIMLSGVLISRRGPVIIGSVCIVFTTASLLLLPHTPALQLYWDAKYTRVLGSAYDVVAIAVLLQALTAVASWLGADSVRRALLDASRAQELALATQRIQEQAQIAEHQRHRLRAGIAHLQQVHAAIARGQWDVRARVEEGELLPVAMSLNLLLDRLSRLTREQDQRTRLEHGALELTSALRRVRAGEPYAPPPYSGTSLDGALVELAAIHATSASWFSGGQTRAAPREYPSAGEQDGSAPSTNGLPPWLQLGG